MFQDKVFFGSLFIPNQPEVRRSVWRMFVEVLARKMINKHLVSYKLADRQKLPQLELQHGALYYNKGVYKWYVIFHFYRFSSQHIVHNVCFILTPPKKIRPEGLKGNCQKKYTMEVKTVKARKSDKVVYKWMEQKAPRFGTNIDRP